MSRDEMNSVQVAAALSDERLGPYLCATGGELAKAVELYEWNLAVSAPV